ncbi:MAG: hypothetical protein QW666_01715 [Candidatus Woesearchaeota archaeon]
MNKIKIAVALIIYLIVLMPASFAQQVQDQAGTSAQDFYTISGVSISPAKGFDRRVVLDISYPVYLQLKIRQKQANPQITAAAKTAQCTGEDVSEIYMINENTNVPYIVVKSAPAIADREKPVKINCTTWLEIKQGKEIIGTEIENFTVQIPVYNNPLGTVSENAKAQIDSIENRIKDLKKREEQWDKINNIFANIVGVAQTVAQLDAEINDLGAALWLISTLLSNLETVPYIGPVCAFLASLLWKYIGCTILNNSIHIKILKYFWTPGIVGGEIFSGDIIDVAGGRILATLIKTVSAIYSCQLCDYGSSLYAGLQTAAYGDMNIGIEGKRGKPTALETFTVRNWEPYKSIHIAMACMCLPGITYNMKKETQINCIYRNCIKQSAELGLPFDTCQQTFKEQNCLYVDSAAWRIAGGTHLAFGLSQQMTYVFEHMPIIQLSRAWSKICDPDCGMFSETEKEDKDAKAKKTESCGTFGQSSSSSSTAYPEECSDHPIDDWEVPLCSVWAGLMMQKETNYFSDNRNPWVKYNADLKGEDYCD